MSSTHLPTPQERLAISRKAIIRHMMRDDTPAAAHDAQPDKTGDESGASSGRSDFWTHALVRAVQTWWRNQPVSIAFGVAKPVLERYAERQPFKLLGAAAIVGAAVVLIRPWRLVSIGGLALAAVKSAAVPSVLMSIFASHAPTKNQKNQKSSTNQPTEPP